MQLPWSERCTKYRQREMEVETFNWKNYVLLFFLSFICNIDLDFTGL